MFTFNGTIEQMRYAVTARDNRVCFAMFEDIEDAFLFCQSRQNKDRYQVYTVDHENKCLHRVELKVIIT